MKRSASLAALCGAAFAAACAQASADTIFEVEHARGIARSGGPVSSHDAEILERWGALSGTPEWRHRTRETFSLYDDEYPPHRSNRRRRPIRK